MKMTKKKKLIIGVKEGKTILDYLDGYLSEGPHVPRDFWTTKGFVHHALTTQKISQETIESLFNVFFFAGMYCMSKKGGKVEYKTESEVKKIIDTRALEHNKGEDRNYVG